MQEIIVQEVKNSNLKVHCSELTVKLYVVASFPAVFI